MSSGSSGDVTVVDLSALGDIFAPDVIAAPDVGEGIWTGSPDSRFDFVEILDTPCDVITAYDGSEQRIRGRNTSVRQFRFTLSQMTAQESGDVLAKLYVLMGQLVPVPAWCDAMILVSYIRIVFAILPVDPSDPSLVDGPAMLWSSRWNYELVTVSGSYLETGVVNYWPQGAFLVPTPLCRMVGEPVVTHMGAGLSRVEFTFMVEDVGYTP